MINAYCVYLDNKAKGLTQNHAIYNESLFQTRDLHFYTTGDGYRYRYKASGTSATIPESEVNNNAMGVDLFNEYGYYIYHKYDLTMTFKDGNTIAY